MKKTLSVILSLLLCLVMTVQSALSFLPSFRVEAASKKQKQQEEKFIEPHLSKECGAFMKGSDPADDEFFRQLIDYYEMYGTYDDTEFDGIILRPVDTYGEEAVSYRYGRYYKAYKTTKNNTFGISHYGYWMYERWLSDGNRLYSSVFFSKSKLKLKIDSGSIPEEDIISVKYSVSTVPIGKIRPGKKMISVSKKGVII